MPGNPLQAPDPSHSAPLPGQAALARQMIWGLLILAALLRLPGLWTDFWLDEIWSWTLAWDFHLKPRITGIWGIFTQVHQDNNNYLNTLFLYLCGPSAPLPVYRIPSFLAGLATIWLGGRLVVRWWQGTGRSSLTAMCVGMGLLATSQVEIVYSSEARGYAVAGLAALASQSSMGSLLRSGRWRSAAVYALVACCGFLGHLSFLPVFLAHAVWSLAALVWSRHCYGVRWRRLAQLSLAFGVPALMVGGLWLVDLSVTHVGGGPELSRILVAFDTLAMPFGASLPEWFNIPAIALLMVMLLLTGLWSLRRVATLEAVGLASLLIIAPAVLFGMAPKGLVYPRHFLVSLTLLLPVAAVGLWTLCTAHRQLIRLAGALAILVWCAGNGLETCRFITYGRGQYQATLSHIADITSGRLTAIGSDFDFRNSMVMAFYQARGRTYRSLRYLPQDYWNQYQPDWILKHDQQRHPQFEKQFELGGYRYDLDQIFPYAGPVGWHWAAYRLAARLTP